MGHVETVVDGISVPSVTQIVGLLDKSLFLVPWASKLGTLKAKALLDVIPAMGVDPVSCIKDEWFEDNRIKRSDFWKEHKQMADEAAKRGSRFHEDIEAVLRKEFGFPQAEANPELIDIASEWAYIRAAEKWAKRVGLKPLAFEEHVVSKDHAYGGTFDCVGEIGDKLEIIDWKLTGQISDTYIIQMAGYWQGYFEKTGKKFDGARVVRPYELKRAAKADATDETAEGYKHSFAGSNIYVEERRYTDLHYYFDMFLKLRELYDFVHKAGKWSR